MTSSERWGNGAEGADTRSETDRMDYYDMSPTARKLLKARVEKELFHSGILMFLPFIFLLVLLAVAATSAVRRSTVVIAWDEAEVNVVTSEASHD